MTQVSSYELYAVDFGSAPDKVFRMQDLHPFVADESTSYVDEAIDDIVVKVGEVVDLGVIELDVIE